MKLDSESIQIVSLYVGTMNSLTLQWYDAEQLKIQIQRIEIPEFLTPEVQGQEVRVQQRYEQQLSKNAGTYRIGRDPSRCDLVLGNPTVSGLHVEIFFDSQQQGFFIRNLRQSNPPLVDGQQLLDNVLPLFEGSTIYLGQQELKVAAVSITKVNTIPPTVLAPPPVPNSRPIIPQQKSQPNKQHTQHHHHHFPSEQPPNGQSSNEEPMYGLQCPKCARVSSLEHLQVGCPWCGTSLAAALSVLVAPSEE